MTTREAAISDVYERLYDVMRKSEMNAWVGGADPSLAAYFSCNIIFDHIPTSPETRLLDFGCGIGRVALGVLKKWPALKLTGYDIVPRMVDFCRDTIGAEFPNTDFQLVQDQNVHYERFKHEAVARSREELIAEQGASFDGVYAFSVFTHVDVNDFVPLLRFVRALMKPGAHFMFTAFLITPYSRNQIDTAKTSAEMGKYKYEQNGAVFIANPDDRLAFIGYDLARVEAMVWEAGLIPTAIEYGEWRGDRMSRTFQDVIVCRRPL